MPLRCEIYRNPKLDGKVLFLLCGIYTRQQLFEVECNTQGISEADYQLILHIPIQLTQHCSESSNTKNEPSDLVPACVKSENAASAQSDKFTSCITEQELETFCHAKLTPSFGAGALCKAFTLGTGYIRQPS